MTYSGHAAVTIAGTVLLPLRLLGRHFNKLAVREGRAAFLKPAVSPGVQPHRIGGGTPVGLGQNIHVVKSFGHDGHRNINGCLAHTVKLDARWGCCIDAHLPLCLVSQAHFLYVGRSLELQVHHHGADRDSLA